MPNIEDLFTENPGPEEKKYREWYEKQKEDGLISVHVTLGSKPTTEGVFGELNKVKDDENALYNPGSSC